MNKKPSLRIIKLCLKVNGELTSITILLIMQSIGRWVFDRTKQLDQTQMVVGGNDAVLGTCSPKQIN
ncbi:hypothetical protein JTE90_009716 [Oedothorax gibbosus]|uniref:Uncharacterized protein n=1 Tax=Oedothorax gibbosus TaxID=931172 RepID=A0AAV6VA12_9ARAC|nr:hypothetical protein JTE90_009716 [Oedothorax gibbosus]